MSSARRTALWIVLSFLWFCGLVISYYITHKPLTPSVFLRTLLILTESLLAVGLVAVAGGLGRRLWRQPARHPLTCAALQVALGLGILCAFWLSFATFLGLQRLVGWLTTLALGLLLRKEIAGWGREWWAIKDMFAGMGLFERLLAALLGGIWVTSLFEALAPPVRFDALVYHLALPQRYLAIGRFVYIPEIMFWGMPQNGEMFYTWGMLLGGVNVALVGGWLLALMAFLGLWGLVYENLGREAAWVSGAALLGGSTLASSPSWGYVDWFMLLFGVAWLAALALWVEDARNSLLFMAGLFAGFGFGTKYSAGLLLPLGLLAIIWKGSPSKLAMLKGMALYGVGFLGAAIPWLVKNLTTTGNPFYPLFFPVGAMTPLRLALYQGGKPFGNWADVLLLPWRATFIGVEGLEGYNASIGPLLFGLCPAAWLVFHRFEATPRLRLGLVTLVTVAGVGMWALAGRFTSYLLQSRLYMGLFPAVAWLAAAGFLGLQNVSFSGVRLGRVTKVLVVLVIALNTYQVGMESVMRGAPQTALGWQAEQEYLERNLGWRIRAMQSLKGLPPESKVLLLWEPQSYYCWPACEPDEVLDRWLNARYDGFLGGKPVPEGEILQRWRRDGFTHLLLHRSGMEFIRAHDNAHYTAEDWQSLEVLLSRLRIVTDFGGAYTLYALTP